MLDAAARRVLDGPLSRVAAMLDRWPISPDGITAAGLVLGLGSAAAAAAAWWWPALLLWLVSRLADGLDGPLARRRRAAGVPGDAGAGGFFDITADFVVYGSGVLGVALGVTRTLGTTWVPFAAVLLAYYVNGAAFLAFSSLAERAGRQLEDGRSLSFLGGLAEGTETVVVHALWLLQPAIAGQLAWGWAVVVGISAVHRVHVGRRALR